MNGRPGCLTLRTPNVFSLNGVHPGRLSRSHAQKKELANHLGITRAGGLRGRRNLNLVLTRRRQCAKNPTVGKATAAGRVGVLLLAGAMTVGLTASQGQASTDASTLARQAPRQTCDRPQPTTFRKVERWGCFSISATISWQASLTYPQGAPCRGSSQFSLRWSGVGGTYWIGDDMTIRRAWNGAPRRWALRDIIMVGLATFNVRFTGQVGSQPGACVPAETLNPRCGTRTIPNYTAGILPGISVGPGGEYRWTPTDYTPTQRPPDYSTCGPPGLQLHVQPLWVTEVRYAGSGSFTLSSVPGVAGSGNTQARAKKAAAQRFLSTRVGRTLVLRAQDRPQAGGPALPFEGSWTATVKAKRIR